ncbi:hypothetical protein QJ857_gp0883 [Tupanvirus soda lake]|uniref:Uncharacterized protein n=1 Tax=Tupanvirus deep ocean TaxID=2126984 RepID=A0AC59HBZ9_9VIRU|nr:hypothetical protein QJ857_gp0883 [Tupanvirus soda lake]AUL77986.2 hypothetical protein [Tupanvirus soda lake]
MDEQIYNKIVRISGPHVNLNHTSKKLTGNEIYGSYHFSNFTKTNASRNTLVRFDEFLVPENLSGKKIFDFGSNLGSLSFESARRNAKSVIGFEYCKERINVCNELANYLKLKNIQFVEFDVDANSPKPLDFINKYGCADIVFCCALDAYVNKENLYKFICEVTNDICYFETNSTIKRDEFIEIMKGHGFELIIPLGTSKSDSGYGRESYILQKKTCILSKRNTRKYDNLTISGNVIYKMMDKVLSKYDDDNIYNNIKNIYNKISDIKYVPKMKFIYPFIIRSYYNNPLYGYDASNDDKSIIKTQLIDFVKCLIKRNIIHRDLHIKNCYFDDKILRVCDWESAKDNVVGPEKYYDVIGKYLFGKEHYMCVLSGSTYSFDKYLTNEHKLCQDDFYTWTDPIKNNTSLK